MIICNAWTEAVSAFIVNEYSKEFYFQERYFYDQIKSNTHF